MFDDTLLHLLLCPVSSRYETERGQDSICQHDTELLQECRRLKVLVAKYAPTLMLQPVHPILRCILRNVQDNSRHTSYRTPYRQP